MQNPSLLLAIEKDPLKYFDAQGVRVERAEDVKLDGQSLLALRVTADAGGGAADAGGATVGRPEVTILVDPSTHLIRRVTTDMSGALKQSGMSDVKKARFIIDYTTTRPGAEFAKDAFAWSPPAGAQDVTEARPAMEQHAAQNLVGRPAPDFKLDSLQGDPVALADLKGQVVVLDFWASWCPPCVESLPHLGQLYAQEDDGVKVLAINLMEDKERVQSFIAERGLQIPVLLDTKGQTASKYNVSSIPQTVLIGPDGVVKQVYVGLGPDTYEDIRQQVQALKGTGGGEQPAPSNGSQGGS